MFEWLWLFLYVIFSVIAINDSLPMPITGTLNMDKIALEPSLEDKHNDNNYDTKMAENIKTDIDDIDNFKQDYKHDNSARFTDFVLAVIEILIRYPDADLKNFFETLNDEIHKYQYNGCKFYELTDNIAFRKLIGEKFNTIKNISALDIRQKMVYIANEIEELKYGSHEKEIIDYINSLYRQDSVEKFNKFLTKINDYRHKTEEDLDLIKVVRDGVRSLIFNHYTKLDYNTRAALKHKLDEYWDYTTAVPSFRAQLNSKEFQLLEHRNDYTDKFYFKKSAMYKTAKNKNRMARNLKFVTLYPKLIMDWKIMGSSPTKELGLRSTTETNFYNFDSDYIQHEALSNESGIIESDFTQKTMIKAIRNTTPVTIRQKSADESVINTSNDSTDNDLNDDSINIGVSDSTATYMSLYLEEMHVPTTKQFQVTDRAIIKKRHKPKRLSTSKGMAETLASLYTVYFRDSAWNEPQSSVNKKSRHNKRNIIKLKQKKRKIIHLTTEKTNENIVRNFLRARINKPFIERVTLRSFITKRNGKSNKSRFHIPTSYVKTQLGSRRQKPFKDVNIFPKKYATVIDNGPSVKKDKQDYDTRYYRRNHDNLLTEKNFFIDGDILARLQELETELDDVKNLAKNDKEMIKHLKSNIKLNKNNSSKEDFLTKVMLSSSVNKKIINSVLEDRDNKQILTDDETTLRNHNDNNHNTPLKDQTEKHHDLVTIERQKSLRRSHTYDRSKFEVINRKGLSNEDTNLQDSSNIIGIKNERDSRYNSDTERDIMPNLDRLEYKKKVDKVLNSDSRQDIYDKYRNSRRTMKNKVEKIKIELDGAIKDVSSNKRQDFIGTYTKIDFEKEYIPDKETFSKNMKTLENLLSSNKK